MPVQGQNPFLTQDQWDKMYNLKRGLAVANMPLDQAIGYGIGALLGNYLGRRDDNIASGNVADSGSAGGMLSGIEDKGPSITDTLGNNSEYVRQAVAANATMPKNATLDQYNQMAADNRTISAYQNMQPQTIEPAASTVVEQVTAAPKENSLLGDADKLKINDDPIIKYALGYFTRPVNFNNAVASDSEAAALSLPDYLKPRIDYYVNMIEAAKQNYANAQTNNDNEGMARANAQAEAARTELNKLGVDAGLFGADRTPEQVQDAVAGLNYYSQPERQNISPFQQQIADKIKGDIVRAKYAYENAMTDNDRMYAQLQAQNARNLAAQYGLDVSAYGADVPAERAMLAAMNETPQFNADNATSQFASNPMSTQEYWQQLYEEARARGAGRTAAERYATQKAAAYQTGRINDLSAQFVQYGVNPDGSVGNLGMSILSQLRTEDPDAYTQLLSAYGMPRDVFATSQQIRRDNNTAQNQMAAMQEQGRINSAMQNQKFEQTKELEQLQAQMQTALYEAKSQIDRAYSNASVTDKMTIMYNWLMQNGVDPQTAGLMAAGVYNSKGSKNSSTKEEKPPTYISEINNLVSQMENAVNQYASFDGDSEEGENLRISSGESIDAVEDYINKNREKFDSQDIDRIMTRMYTANYKRALAAYYKTNNPEYKKQADEYKPYVPVDQQ
ncbi:hypothetical protein [Megamonas hypermegale]|uniref:hypothetical protein n=1 Tax=Megamonas hypermegale TaxID=158847 RepID=UPI0026F1CB87|nr:hypothetical protein [Megamonas hypermegale]